jgi:hypothetical protein
LGSFDTLLPFKKRYVYHLYFRHKKCKIDLLHYMGLPRFQEERSITPLGVVAAESMALGPEPYQPNGGQAMNPAARCQALIFPTFCTVSVMDLPDAAFNGRAPKDVLVLYAAAASKRYPQLS